MQETKDLALTDRVKKLITPLIRQQGLELWDVIWLREAGRQILRVMVEKPGQPINLDDCSRISRLVDDVLEVSEVITAKYDLEVSSPGLNRPLIQKDHFSRFLGENIRLKTIEPIEGRRNYKGSLKKVEGDNLIVEVDHQDHVIAYQNVFKANVEYY